MYKASPQIPVPELAKTAAGDEASVPAVTDFVNITTSYAQMKAGKLNAINAKFVNLDIYDRARVSFAELTVAGGPTTAILTLYRKLPDDTRVAVGTSALTDGSFPPIEFDVVAPESWALRVTLAGGSSPAVTVTPLVQGFYRAGIATN